MLNEKHMPRCIPFFKWLLNWPHRSKGVSYSTIFSLQAAACQALQISGAVFHLRRQLFVQHVWQREGQLCQMLNLADLHWPIFPSTPLVWLQKKFIILCETYAYCSWTVYQSSTLRFAPVLTPLSVYKELMIKKVNRRQYSGSTYARCAARRWSLSRWLQSVLGFGELGSVYSTYHLQLNSNDMKAKGGLMRRKRCIWKIHPRSRCCVVVCVCRREAPKCVSLRMRPPSQVERPCVVLAKACLQTV